MATIEVAPNFWRVTARYGFMERPDIPALLRQAREQGCCLDPDDVTYYVAHETIIHREDGKGLARVGGDAFRRDGAKRRACQRFLQPSTRQRRRNRPAGRDLIFSAHAAAPGATNSHAIWRHFETGPARRQLRSGQRGPTPRHRPRADRTLEQETSHWMCHGNWFGCKVRGD